MKPRDMGRFLSAFLEGFVEGDAAATEPAPPPVAPMVIPVDAVRQAVREFLQPLIEDETPSAPDLDLYTHNIERAPVDAMAESIRQRVEDTRAQAQRDRHGDDAAATWVYHPNDPGSGAPWMSPVNDK